LHKCGDITLGQLQILSQNKDAGPAIVEKDWGEDEFPLADVPMPDNIRNFNRIIIRFAFLNSEPLHNIAYLSS
jgi:hypothetical protein